MGVGVVLPGHRLRRVQRREESRCSIAMPQHTTFC